MSARRTLETPDNPLKPMVSSSRGLTPERALADARARVRALGAGCLREADRRLARLAAFVERPQATLRASDLQGLRRQAEAALTACGGLDRPWLAHALLILSAQCDALLQRGAASRDELGPAIRAVMLLRADRVSDVEATVLLDGLGRCLERFVGDPSDNGRGAP